MRRHDAPILEYRKPGLPESTRSVIILDAKLHPENERSPIFFVKLKHLVGDPGDVLRPTKNIDHIQVSLDVVG